MIKEIKLTKLYCDCCGTEKDDPIAISGYASQVGWGNTREVDLCGICSYKLNREAVHKLSKDLFDEIIKKIKEEA